MHTQSSILVVGPAHLMVSAHINDQRSQNEGMSIDIGGYGAELAANVAMYGGRARLLTALPDSPFTQIIEDVVSSSGVEMSVEYTQDFVGVPGQATLRDESTQAITRFSASTMNIHQFNDATIEHAYLLASVIVLTPDIHPYTLASCLDLARSRALHVILFDPEGEAPVHDLPGAEDCILITSPAGWAKLTSSLEEASRISGGGRHLPSRRAILDGFDATLQEGDQSETFKSVLRANEPDEADIYRKSFASILAVTLASHPGMGAQAATFSALDAAFNPSRSTHRTCMMEVVAENSTDAITGLPNRKFTEKKIANLSGIQPLSFVFVDLDHFKSINDTFGHDMGDVILHSAALTMRQALRAGDICARWGGEEFLCVIRGAGPNEAIEAAERIRSAISSSVAKPDGTNVTASLGVATMDGGEWRRAIAKADEALYRAKRAGRNCVRYAGVPHEETDARPDAGPIAVDSGSGIPDTQKNAQGLTPGHSLNRGTLQLMR